MAKRVLVTGGTGFIGRHTLQPLIDKGFEVTVVTSQPARVIIGRDIKDIPTSVLFSTCNLLDPKEVKSLLENLKPEYLLHLAWDVMPGYKDSNHNVDWMNASLNLVHQFANCGGRRAVLAGTCFDYEATTLYGTCKRSLWNILNYAKFTDSLELAYGRIYYLYGPHEHSSRLVPIMINGLLDDKSVNILSKAEQLFNLSYVQDVADAFVQILDGYIQGEFDIIGKPTSALEIATTIIDLLDVNKGVEFGHSLEKYRNFHEPYNALKLGERKLISLVRGMTRTIDWWKAQRLQGI